MSRELIIDLVRHMKARSLGKSGADQERPLSKLGLRQAEMHAGVMALGDPILGVYSSPALRCRQTMEPLARRLGLEVQIERLLADTRLLTSLPIGGENPLVSKLWQAHLAGGRIVACSHADTIPAFLALLDDEQEWSLPKTRTGFGGWVRVRLDGDDTLIEQIEAPEGFPED